MKFFEKSGFRAAIAAAAIASAPFQTALAGAPNPEAVRPLAEFSERLGMPNLAKKLEEGKNVKIAYLGGSRTAGASTPENIWRASIRKRASGKSTPPSGEPAPTSGACGSART